MGRWKRDKQNQTNKQMNLSVEGNEERSRRETSKN